MIVSRAGPATQQLERQRPQFSLGALLWLTTLVAVSLGLIQSALPLGIALVVASPAALARTVRAAAIAKSNDRPMSAVALIGTFADSLVVVASMALAWLCTFVAACFAAGLLVVIVLGSLGGFLATCLAHLSQAARWLEKRLVRGIARCTAVNAFLSRRFWLQYG